MTWDRSLPSFSGDGSVCKKCGHAGASTKFMAYGRCAHATDAVVGWDANERLHRSCNRCGFSWDETTMVDPRNWDVDARTVTASQEPEHNEAVS